MGSPFDVGRDSNAASSNQFSDTSTVSDSHVGSFQDAFSPPSDNLAERDYRETGTGVVPNPTESPTPHGVPAEKPGEFGYPTPRPGGSINL